MGLGWSAITLAGHVTIMLALLCTFANAMATRARWPDAWGAKCLALVARPLIAFASAICVERMYYTTARVLQGSGVNLWMAHPAPELLSLMVAAPLIWLMVSARLVAGHMTARDYNVLMAQGGGIVCILALVTWVLW